MFLKFRKIHWKAPVFSCKFCKIFKNTFFTKHLRATASDNVYLITLPAFSSPTILLSTIEFPIIDGEFGKWSHYSKCSHLCGGEIQNHTRKSNSPAPANGGADCVGTRVETPKCSIKPFPVNDPCGNWSKCSTRSVSCGGGVQSRKQRRLLSLSLWL